MVKELKVLKYKDRIVFERISMSTFSRMPKFYQENEACFIFVNKGEFLARTPEDLFNFNQETGMLSKCFDFFLETSKAQRNTYDAFEAVGVLLYPSLVEELFEFDIKQSKHTVNYNMTQVNIDGLLHNFKESINILIDNPELADENLIKTKLKEFILLMSKSQNAPSQVDFLSALFKKNHSDFSKTITNNLYSNLSIIEYAHLCNMSVSSFKRRFEAEFKNTPKKYILEMRLEKASKLLSYNDLRISDVAYHCGFETISTFNRAFKSHFGKSPSKYRLDLFA